MVLMAVSIAFDTWWSLTLRDMSFSLLENRLSKQHLDVPWTVAMIPSVMISLTWVSKKIENTRIKEERQYFLSIECEHKEHSRGSNSPNHYKLLKVPYTLLFPLHPILQPIDLIILTVMVILLSALTSLYLSRRNIPWQWLYYPSSTHLHLPFLRAYVSQGLGVEFITSYNLPKLSNQLGASIIVIVG